MKRLHLICNAHLDPVWLWPWEEGAAEALSTFRIAADLCEEYPGFVFNHNEVILYKWVEEYEPALFKRIQKLVKQGKWHIMGGWYLQPDCNMPSGESFVRQALAGRIYFQDKFGATPTTAINFDPFGHTRGLVQILQKSGYDSYIVCRPDQGKCELPANDFNWVGFDGSTVRVCRQDAGYNSLLGQARSKVENWLKNEANANRDITLLLWGIGNHGGGPSRLDLKQLAELMKQTKDCQIVHSTPEAAFKDMAKQAPSLPRVEKDLNPWGVGCYTSQVRIKQKHRQLENELYTVEKMASSVALQGIMAYPKSEIDQVIEDLAYAQFHDILPGSSIQTAEETSLRLMDHGLEILSRVKARTFFALASGQPKAKENEIPFLAYNPHPFPVTTTLECEFQPANQNWKDEFSFPVVYQGKKRLPCQAEKEESTIPIDWRKRSVFTATLPPMQVSRFDVKLDVLPKKPEPKLKLKNGKFTFKTSELQVVINAATGLVDKFIVGKKSVLKSGAFKPLVIADNADPWGMTVRSFRNLAGEFKLMNKSQAARFAGIFGSSLDPVRVIEDGEVRTVIEAFFAYGDSFICQRYKLPKQGTEVELELAVYWNEKNKMLKLSVPTSLKAARYFGQVAYGAQDLPANGDEAVAQKWTAAVSDADKFAFTCINDSVYGSDFANGEMRLSLLRSPGYSAHPIEDREYIPQDRYSPHIDQGRRNFRFWFNAGAKTTRLDAVDREALAHNEKPFVLSFFPSGQGKKPLPLAKLQDNVVQLGAFKKAEKGSDYILRLFEPTGKRRTTTLVVPPLGIHQKITLGGFEIKTLRLNLKKKTLRDVNLMEE
jgi:alpha-mannosidase